MGWKTPHLPAWRGLSAVLVPMWSLRLLLQPLLRRPLPPRSPLRSPARENERGAFKLNDNHT